MEPQLEITIPIVVFNEEGEGLWYAYCPALDVMGYDTSEDGATTSLSVVLHETIDYMVAHGTLDEELRRLGWEKTEGRRTSPAMETLLRKNENLRRMMALPHSLIYGSVPVM